MPDPLRLVIQKALCAKLREITVANGYALDFRGEGLNKGDAPQRVFRGRTVYGTSDPLPMLSVLETPIPLEQLEPPKSSGLSSGSWELMVQGFFADDSENPTDPAHVGLADVRKILAIESLKPEVDHTNKGILDLGNHITGLKIGAGVVRPPDEVSDKAYFWLLIEIEMNEDLTEPYTV